MLHEIQSRCAMTFGRMWAFNFGTDTEIYVDGDAETEIDIHSDVQCNEIDNDIESEMNTDINVDIVIEVDVDVDVKLTLT